MSKFFRVVTAVLYLCAQPAFSGVEKEIDVSKVQAILSELCFDPGPVDGIWGKKTERAVTNLYASVNDNYDGVFDSDDFEFLQNYKIAEGKNSCGFKSKLKFTSNGRPVEHSVNSNGVIFFPKYEQLPIELSPPADDETLSLYFERRMNDPNRFDRFEVHPARNANQFKVQIKNSEFLKKQLSENSILSYLFYEKGTIFYDGLAPDNRFSFKLNNGTKYPSHSVGKSIVSYLVGHAICEGYIDSLDQNLSDWSLVEDTLYGQQPLIDILNMSARDHHVVTEARGMIKSGRWFNANFNIADLVASDLNGTTPNASNKFNYNGLATNIALNYVIFKTGKDWEQFLKNIFNEKVKIQHSVMFLKHRGSGSPDFTRGWYYFFATKYDYLRIAIAMMNDWQADNCVGKYLKTLVKQSVRNGRQRSARNLKTPHMDIKSYRYGGYFYLDFPGMRNRNILGMAGYGGQDIFIDMDNLRIVVINSATTNYNWVELGYNAIRSGKLRD